MKCVCQRCGVNFEAEKPFVAQGGHGNPGTDKLNYTHCAVLCSDCEEIFHYAWMKFISAGQDPQAWYAEMVDSIRLIRTIEMKCKDFTNCHATGESRKRPAVGIPQKPGQKETHFRVTRGEVMKQHDEHVKKYRRTIARQGLKAFLDLVDVVGERYPRAGLFLLGAFSGWAIASMEDKPKPRPSFRRRRRFRRFRR
jgi:hypothetical protein